MPASLTYGDLKTCSPEYEELAPVWEGIDDFYVGGYKLAQKAGQYIPKHLGENQRRYADRIRAGSYFNYFGQITDYFASALFTQELAIRPASDHDDKATPGEDLSDAEDDEYSLFSKNADGNGRSLNEVLAALTVTVLKQRTAWLRIEMPAAMPVRTRAEEEQLGLGMPYLFEVPHEDVIDWDVDDEDELSYAVVHCVKRVRGVPGARLNLLEESFEVWRMDGAAGDEVAVWERYAITYAKDKAPKNTTKVPLVAEGVTSFPRIPLLRMEIPEGLWLGNKLAPMAREHYARRTSLNSAEDRSLVAIPVMKRGAEIPAAGEGISETQSNPDRGADPVATFVAKGYEVIGSEDSIEFVEPKGTAYQHVAGRIEDLKNEMFRVAHQLAASASMGSAAVKRSGKSKEEDRAAEALVLGALGRVVRAFGVRLFDTISRAKGDDVVWVAHGLDTYEHEERLETLQESIQIQAVAIPSPTFRKEHCKRVYRKLVSNLSPQTTAQIDKEIEDGVDEEQALRDLTNEVRKDQLENPDPPDPVAKPGSGTRVPSAKDDDNEGIGKAAE